MSDWRIHSCFLIHHCNNLFIVSQALHVVSSTLVTCVQFGQKTPYNQHFLMMSDVLHSNEQKSHKRDDVMSHPRPLPSPERGRLRLVIVSSFLLRWRLPPVGVGPAMESSIRIHSLLYENAYQPCKVVDRTDIRKGRDLYVRPSW